MNQYSQLLYFLKQLAEAHPMVNTVTKGLAENIDLEKANIFPLVHITIDEANFVNGQTIGFNVTLECLTERLLNKKVVDNKFWRQDNEVDNHNETLAILNYMWTSIFRDWNENNMTTSDEPTLTKIEFSKGNILDGWAMTFEVEVPNTALTLCDITFEDIEAVVSAGIGGTVLPGVGTFTLLYGSNNAYYAEPESGYRFLKWLYDGLENLVNPIAIKAVQSYILVANFIRQFQLTTSIIGNGNITPESGIKDDGETVTITVTPTNPLTHELEKIEVTPDGEAKQTFYTSPLNWTILKAVEIVGYIKEILQYFDVTIIKVGNGTVTPDVGVHNYAEGTEVTVTVTIIDPDFHLDSLTVDSIPVTNPYVLTISNNHLVSALFVQTNPQPFYSDLSTLHDVVELQTTLINETEVFETADIYYKYTPLHIEAQEGSKSFAVDKNDYLYTSNDNSLSFTKRTQWHNARNIHFSHMFENGNILFATANKLYFTSDNFATIIEKTVLDTLGNPIGTTHTGEYFANIIPDKKVKIGAIEHLVWGNYTNINSLNSEINIYHTKDNGVTVTMIYQFGQNPNYNSYGNASNPLITRHVHAINYNQNNGKWIIQTGDFGAGASTYECHWIEATYSDPTWSFNVIKSGDTSSYSKTGGFYFDTSNNCYFAGDYTNTIVNGSIIKVPYSTLLNSGTYTKILLSALRAFGLMGNGNELIINSGVEFAAKGNINISNDLGATIKTINISDENGVDEDFFPTRIRDKNNIGFYKFDKNWFIYDGGSMFVKIK